MSRTGRWGVNKIAILTIAGALLAPSPALACDCIRLDPNGPHFAADLERITAHYPIAAEGVLEPDGELAWRFRPTREYRGLKQASYPIDLISDCSLSPGELTAIIGKPLFVLLGGHGNRFEISRCVNFLSPDVEQAIRRKIADNCKSR